MKTLFEYIIESLIDFKELREKMTFKECTHKDIINILNSDEYNFGKDLGYSDKDELEKGVMFLENEEATIFYKIMYEDKIIGITSLFYLKDYKTIERKTERYILNNLINSLGFNKDFSNENNINDFYNKSVYVVVLQLSKDKKSTLDINNIAGIKVFYEKLIDMLKSNNIKYIMAHGKNEKTVKGYIKVGGFESYKDKYLTNNVKNLFDKNFGDSSVYNNFVVKKI